MNENRKASRLVGANLKLADQLDTGKVQCEDGAIEETVLLLTVDSSFCLMILLRAFYVQGRNGKSINLLYRPGAKRYCRLHWVQSVQLWLQGFD